MIQRPRVLLACDASAQIGMGHLSRLRGLAGALATFGEVYFAVPGDPALKQLVSDAGVAVWDRGRLRDALAHLRPDCLFLDGAGDAEMVTALRGSRPRTALAVTEYWMLRDLSVDLAVVPYEPFPERPPIRARRRLEGLSYLFLREEAVARARSGRQVRRSVERLLMSFGSVDPTGHTVASLEALMVRGAEERSIEVVVGPFSDPSAVARVNELAACAAHTALLVSPPDFIQRLAEVDVVLCAGGITLAEAACLGVPAISWPHSSWELRFAEAFVQAGAAVMIREAPELAPTLERLGVARTREAMAAAGRRLIDGRGAERVAEAVRELVQRGRHDEVARGAERDG